MQLNSTSGHVQPCPATCRKCLLSPGYPWWDARSGRKIAGQLTGRRPLSSPLLRSRGSGRKPVVQARENGRTLTISATSSAGMTGDGPRRGVGKGRALPGALRARRADAWGRPRFPWAGGGPPITRRSAPASRGKQRLTGRDRAVRMRQWTAIAGPRGTQTGTEGRRPMKAKTDVAAGEEANSLIKQLSASSPHGLHRFCISSTYALHPLVTVLSRSARWVSDHPRPVQAQSPWGVSMPASALIYEGFCRNWLGRPACRHRRCIIGTETKR